MPCEAAIRIALIHVNSAPVIHVPHRKNGTAVLCALLTVRTQPIKLRIRATLPAGPTGAIIEYLPASCRNLPPRHR